MALRQAATLKATMGGAVPTAVGVAGLVRFYTGAQVGSFGDSEAANTLIGTITLPNPAFSVDGNGVVTLTGSWTTITVATGLIGHAVVLTSGGTPILDGKVTDLVGDGDFKVTQQTSTFIGQQITATAFQLVIGG